MNATHISMIIGMLVGGALAPFGVKLFNHQRQKRAINKKGQEVWVDDKKILYGNDYVLTAPSDMIDYLYPVSMFREVDVLMFDQLCELIDAYYKAKKQPSEKIDGTYVAVCRGLLMKAQQALFDFVKAIRGEGYPAENLQEFEEYANSVEELLNLELAEIQNISLHSVF